MRKLLLLIVLLSAVGYCYAQESQELPKIVPPSPNAAAFHVYGNTQVNNYSGAPNITIPIYEVVEGDLKLPIYLKYTGGNGIKVEEVASWVGLGWTLNTGGAISRVQRSLADEDANGYLNIGSLPSLDVDSQGYYTDLFNIQATFAGERDAEPDLFMYNFPGGSGQFHLQHNGNAFFRPKNNLDLAFRATTRQETIQQNVVEPVNGSLGMFTIKNELGYIYEFDERERSNTTVNAHGSFPFSNINVLDDRAFPSSWMLTRMRSPISSNSIDFSYEGYIYEDIRLQANIKAFGHGQSEEVKYAHTYYMGKRIQTISFSNGTVNFITGNARKDLAGDKTLQEIQVKDKDGKLIKRFVFAYQYMTPFGLKEENAVSGVCQNDESMEGGFCFSNRLILSSITEYDAQGQSKPPYAFTYNTEQVLPSRDSKAKDHWGYYNGKDNTKHFPRHFVERYDREINQWVDEVYGTADRSVSTSHEQSGILTEIQYPTGGKTVFSYESHTAVSDKLTGVLNQNTKDINQENVVENMDIVLQTIPFSRVKMETRYVDSSSMGCHPVYHIKNLATGITREYPLLPGENPPENTSIIVYEDLKEGSYQVWMTIESDTNICQINDPIISSITWENESDNPNKLVGGVRVAQIKDVSESQEMVRIFNYDDSPGITSGRVVSTPKYSFLKLDRYQGSVVPGTDNELFYFELQPNGHVHHSVPSLYPLVNTQGSTVGYGKVTTSHIDTANGKIEYFYTTAEQYPDTYESKFMKYGIKKIGTVTILGEEHNVYEYTTLGFEYQNEISFLGRSISMFPVVVADSKDFLRGLLSKEIRYKKNDTDFTKVYEKEHIYDNLYISRHVNHALPIYIDDYIDLPENSMEGITISQVGTILNSPALGDTPNNAVMHMSRYYDLYTGYAVPKEVIEKNYTESGSLITTATHHYKRESQYNTIDFFFPTQTVTTDSSGKVIKTKTSYAHDLGNTTLINAHRIAVPVKVETFVQEGETTEKKISETYKVYKDFGSYYLPEILQSVKGEEELEDHIVFHSYYNDGNIKEVSKKNGTHVVYI